VTRPHRLEQAGFVFIKVVCVGGVDFGDQIGPFSVSPDEVLQRQGHQSPQEI